MEQSLKLLRKKITHWLSCQLLWLRNICVLKRIDCLHFNVTKSNEMDQFNLLYMPYDKLYGNTHKYIHVRIDVVTRPSRTKKAVDVAEMIKNIYKAGFLR